MSTARNLAPVVAVRCSSDFPAAWLDSSCVAAEHDERDETCGCSTCDDTRRAAVRALSEHWLLRFEAAENDQHERSKRPTIRVPKLTVCTNELE
jgi:hypothetical protein